MSHSANKTHTRRCIIHIGFHKTGSTSIQRYLQINRRELAARGIHFYKGMHADNNHVELHASTMRADRSSSFRLKSGLTFDGAYRSAVAQSVNRFFEQVGDDVGLFSAEGLSLLCHADETERLAALLSPEASIVVYLRNPAEYLRSHLGQLNKSGIAEAIAQPPQGYVGVEHWLSDYEFRLAAFRRTFGHANVHVMDYDSTCARDGSVIPSFLEHLGVAKGFADDPNRFLRLNQS